MNNGPEPALGEHTASPSPPKKKCPPARQRYFNRLVDAVSAVGTCLNNLARLGRPGHWVLHHDDLYNKELDTRPQTRKHDKEIPIEGVTFYKAPIGGRRLIWAGEGPVPNFTDIRFWVDKRKDLEEKIEQVKVGSVQPCFTPEELQTLEALEQQYGHFFRKVFIDRKREMESDKRCVFNRLFQLAALGRPGQWILHHEELYHPVIDTRPQSRASEKRIVIRDEIFKGDTRVLGDGVLYDYELTWAGTGLVPDFADCSYWKNKALDLLEKRRQVEDGLVHPDFTPEELRVVEAMEMDEDHLFAQCVKARRENPPKAKRAKPKVLPIELRETRTLVWSELMSLWDIGRAGQWVLYHEKLYIPKNEIRLRDSDSDDDDDDDDDARKRIIIPGPGGMRYDGYEPFPDFESLAYWSGKLAELRKKSEEIEAGNLKHHFTPGELMRIELLEREQMNQRCYFNDTGRHEYDSTARVKDWFKRNEKETMAQPPLPPPSSFLQHVAKGDKKRKRSTTDDDESLPETAKRPVKRSKEQSQPDPIPMISTHSGQKHGPPLQERQGLSKTRMKTDGHQLTGHKTQQLRPDFVQGGNNNARRQAQCLSGGTGRHLRRRSGSKASPPLRRSARIASQPPKNYR